MKKISIFLFSSTLLFSCVSKSYDLVGNYASHKSSFTEKLINKISNEKCVVLGVKLVLEKDSTFTINTCSYIASGTWEVKKDSLFLNYLTKENYVDSLKSYVKSIEKINDLKNSEVFLIQKKHLIRYVKSQEENCIIKLEK